MRLLITGARGFLGSSLASFATAHGFEVLGFGRTAQAPHGWPGQYAWADAAQTDLAPIIDGYLPDLVFHGAGSASVAESFQRPVDDLRASVLTFANLLDGVRRSQSRPVVLFPSSAAVYGNPIRLPVSEDDPTQPISPYGFHKLAAEQLGREYATCHGLRIVIGRIFSVIGPRQRRLLLWELFQQFSGESAEVILHGSGLETRDFVHVGDLCKLFLELGTNPVESGREQIVNLASGQETSIAQFVETVGRLLGSDKRVNYAGGDRPGDPLRWVAEIARLRASVKMELQFDLSADLSRSLIFGLKITALNESVGLI